EEVVGIVREVFGKGNDFAKKITYRTDSGDPEQGHVRQAGGDSGLWGARRPDAVAPVEGCLQSVRLRAAIDGMADCAAAAVRLSSPAPDGAPLRGCGA